ncbi:MAG: membrane protein insertion efficiency factor YidD [Sphingobacteriaceae bacterium]|nr:membrane protein insertion efficiency factor YidD [Sphingobacteriaceae bacterium]
MKDKESSTGDYINFYQKYISEIRGQECPMYPSCSNFGLKSFKETSFVEAFLLVSDRLLRCGHDQRNYSLTLRANGFKNLDYPHYDNPPNELYYKGNQYFYSYADTAKDAESAIKLIKSLINEGLFHEALLEINRSKYRQQIISPELFINELICLRALGEFEKAIYAFEMKCPKHLKADPEILYELSLNYSSLANYDKALQIINKAAENTTDKYLKVKLHSAEARFYARQYQWEESAMALNKLKDLPVAQKILDDKLSLLKSSLPLKTKKPEIAALISIVPGAGYAYSGHKQTAVSAFIINGLLTYATYSNIKNKNYGMSMLTGVFNLSFYIGNIYGASKSAKRFNEQQRKNLSDKLIYNL